MRRPDFLRDYSPKVRESICRSILLRKKMALSKSGYQSGRYTAVEVVREEDFKSRRNERGTRSATGHHVEGKVERFRRVKSHRTIVASPMRRRPLSRGVVGMRVCTYVLDRSILLDFPFSYTPPLLFFHDDIQFFVSPYDFVSLLSRLFLLLFAPSRTNASNPQTPDESAVFHTGRHE